jgi:hypothetical protein
MSRKNYHRNWFNNKNDPGKENFGPDSYRDRISEFGFMLISD